MRLLEEHELVVVGGAGVDTYVIHLPLGATWSSRLEANNSTTLTIQGQGWALQWNSGEFISCASLGVGVGFIVHTLSGGAKLIGAFIGSALDYGCSYAFSHTDEDGDEF